MKTFFSRPVLFRDWLFSVVHWPSPETTEWFCLRSALWWVIQLAPCLHVFTVSGAFSGLAHYGPEGRWQMLVAGLLALQVLGVCLGNIWMRVGTLFCFGALWAFVAGMFWASSPHWHGVPRNTGAGVYASLSADCMIVAIHLVKLWYWDHLVRRLAQCRAAEKPGEDSTSEEGSSSCPAQEGSTSCPSPSS